jgi:hypothetical protein
MAMTTMMLATMMMRRRSSSWRRTAMRTRRMRGVSMTMK